MANFVYNHAKHLFGQGSLNLGTPEDLRVILVMSNTTADTEDDVTTVDGFTTLDECDGASYARQELGGDAYAKDAANNRSEYDATDITFTNLGAGTRQNVGMVLYKHVTNDTDSIPIAYYDTGGFPFDGDGTTTTVQWNAEGVLQLG